MQQGAAQGKGCTECGRHCTAFAGGYAYISKKDKLSLLSEGDAGVLLLGQLWLCSEPGPSAEHRALQVLHSPLDDAVVELEVARY